MSKIVLDFGSGNTCKNDILYVRRMIEELRAIDTGKHEVIIKWQLFKKAGANVPLEHSVFQDAYMYAHTLGYKTTASVFDIPSLEFLLGYNIPFVKIANNDSLHHLIGYIPRHTPVYVSRDRYQRTEKMLMISDATYVDGGDSLMVCISKYPATIKDYEDNFNGHNISKAVSDHTTTFELFQIYEPKIVEWHYKLEDSTGLDAGLFARTPLQLKEVL